MTNKRPKKTTRPTAADVRQRAATAMRELDELNGKDWPMALRTEWLVLLDAEATPRALGAVLHKTRRWPQQFDARNPVRDAAGRALAVLNALNAGTVELTEQHRSIVRTAFTLIATKPRGLVATGKTRR